MYTGIPMQTILQPCSPRNASLETLQKNYSKTHPILVPCSIHH